MRETDGQLLEEYKRVDRICQDMFSCQYGITEYINEMERTAPYQQLQISGWDQDYRSLKHIRWLRNQLVHEIHPESSTFADIEWLEDFHQRIVEQQDPLAKLSRFEWERIDEKCSAVPEYFDNTEEEAIFDIGTPYSQDFPVSWNRKRALAASIIPYAKTVIFIVALIACLCLVINFWYEKFTLLFYSAT
ncbi:MAG: hypothetical protein HFE78_03190 [Clostridiales bacterium]|nr:hypothetical protein [Clostridiales bacterium]